MGECLQQKHTQHAPSTKRECDYPTDWIFKKTVASEKKISPKIVNPRVIAENAEAEEEEEEEEEKKKKN